MSPVSVQPISISVFRFAADIAKRVCGLKIDNFAAAVAVPVDRAFAIDENAVV